MSKYQVMVKVSHLLKAKGVEAFVIGATARDLLAERSGVPPSERKTEDVDFAVLLPNWETLDALRGFFLQNSEITASANPSNKIRYYYQGVPFDLVPFGGVANQHVVSWPPHQRHPRRRLHP